jgi:Mrp family chromosome partitioning ATPase
VALLVRILARTGLSGAPIIQIMPCEAGGQAADVALNLTTVSASRLGRTLLIDATTVKAAAQEHAFELRPAILPTVRDVFIPALHHAHLGISLGDRRHSDEVMRAALSATARSFRLLAVTCPSVRESPAALALSPLCSGTLLVVRAGHTLLQDVQAAARDVQAAKGHVLGTVLTQAPPNLPHWLDPPGRI